MLSSVSVFFDSQLHLYYGRGGCFSACFCSVTRLFLGRGYWFMIMEPAEESDDCELNVIVVNC